MATLEKSWTRPEAGHRKFIATVLTHALSRQLMRTNFEVVQEGNIDLHNPDSDAPDVIIYDIRNNYTPVLMIELCTNATVEDTLRTVEIIREIYFVNEAFVYNIDSEEWHAITPGKLTFTSISNQFKVELSELLQHYLHRYI